MLVLSVMMVPSPKILRVRDRQTDKHFYYCNPLRIRLRVEICGRITMLIYYIVDSAYQLQFLLLISSKAISAAGMAPGVEPRLSKGGEGEV